MMILPSVILVTPIKAFSPVNDNSIICSISFDPPILRDIEIDNSIFTEIYMENCISQAKIGDPVLPVYPALIQIPEGKKVSNIRAKYGKSVDINYDLINKPIIPQQELYPFSKGSGNIQFLKNEDIYESSKPALDFFYKEGDIGFCRGFSILTVYLFPVKYTPNTGDLSFFQNIMIILELNDIKSDFFGEQNRFIRYHKDDVNVINSMVENPISIETYEPYNSIFEELGGKSNGDYTPLNGGVAPLDYSDGLCDPSDSYEYVIITNNALKDTAGYDYNWTDLIDHRQSYSGLNGIIVTVEEIDTCSDYWNGTALFNDTQAHIREFCKDAYEDWGMQFLLLGGDCDSDGNPNIVPYRLFEDRYESETYDKIPCDMYYNHLDGDWYYSGSGGMWGGGRGSGVNDPYAEFYLGRLTVTNAEQVSNIVKKIIYYDTTELEEWYSISAFFGGELGWSATSKDYMEELRQGTGSFSENVGFEEWNSANSQYLIATSEQIYDEDYGSYTQYQAAVKQSINNDNTAIINHLDHGSTTFALSMSSSEIRSLTNTKPFFAYSQGCLSGRFISGTTSEQMLTVEDGDNRALATVLNTGYGYGSYSTTAGSSQHLQKLFWDYFFNCSADNQNNWQLGKAQAYSKDKLSAFIDSSSWSHAWCYVWYSSHFFGDPAQTIKIEEIDNSFTIDNENPSDGSSYLPLSLSTLIVKLKDPLGSVFDWSIETSPDIGSNSGNNELNGSKSCSISNLDFATDYIWFVNLTNGNVLTEELFSFTTRPEYIPSEPDSFSVISNGKHQIDLQWNKCSRTDTTLIEWKNTPGNWNIGEGQALYNYTDESISHTGLEEGTTVYYQAWSWNETDKIWGDSYSSGYAMTDTNAPPTYNNENPSNNSNDIYISTSLISIDIYDLDGDLINWTIETSPNIGESSEFNDANGTISCPISNINYSLCYHWYLNITDGKTWTKSSYIFTIEDETTNNPPNKPTNPNPLDGSSGIDINIDLSWTGGDPDSGDDVTYDVFFGVINPPPQIVNNQSGTSYNCESLDYETTYYWVIKSWDNNDNINISEIWSFTTSSSSSSPPSAPSSPAPPPLPPSNSNTPPIAKVGGPYTYCINQIVSFNGSGSYDSDGNINSFLWDFGDYSTGEGIIIMHTYSNEGSYTLTLTCEDDGGAFDIDTTTVIIYNCWDNGKNNNINALDQDNNLQENLSDYNIVDDLPDEIKKDIISELENASIFEKINLNNITHYIVGINDSSDVQKFSFVFYNTVSKKTSTACKKDEQTLLIDEDDDGIWDYEYDITTHVFSSFSSKKELEKSSEIINTNFLIGIVGFVLTTIILLGCFFKKKKLNS